MYPGVELRLNRYVVVFAEELNFTPRGTPSPSACRSTLHRGHQSNDGRVLLHFHDRNQFLVWLAIGIVQFLESQREIDDHAIDLPGRPSVKKQMIGGEVRGEE
jgi:hypothetical protein